MTDTISYMDPPAHYGLMSDAAYKAIRIETTPEHVLRELRLGDVTAARFTNWHEKIYRFPICTLYPLGGAAENPLDSELDWSPALYRQLAETISCMPKWTCGRFCALDAKAALQFQQSLSARRLPHRVFTYPAYVISGHNSFEHYLAARSKSYRSSYSSAAKKAAKQGFELRKKVGLEAWLRLYARRHGHGNFQEQDYSIADGFHTLLRRTIETFAAAGKIVEFGLWRGEQIAAAGVGLVSRDVLYFFQTAHDPDFQEIRPGALIFNSMIKAFFELKLSLLSFMGDAPYLTLYTSQAVRLHELEVYTPSPSGRLLYHYRKYRKSVPGH